MIEELERLGAMMEKGLLSAEEFTLAKAELLTPGRSRPAAKAELSPTVACTHINIYRAAIATVTLCRAAAYHASTAVQAPNTAEHSITNTDSY